MHTFRKFLLTILIIVVTFGLVIAGSLGFSYSGADPNTTAILSFFLGLLAGWPAGIIIATIWDMY